MSEDDLLHELIYAMFIALLIESAYTTVDLQKLFSLYDPNMEPTLERTIYISQKAKASW